jgi:hypothetical protein
MFCNRVVPDLGEPPMKINLCPSLRFSAIHDIPGSGFWVKGTHISRKSRKRHKRVNQDNANGKNLFCEFCAS